mgnify:CR=1
MFYAEIGFLKKFQFFFKKVLTFLKRGVIIPINQIGNMYFENRGVIYDNR